MSRMLRTAALALVGLISLPAFAESCYVTSDSAVAGPGGIRTESCYEHIGMPMGSLNWSCNDNTKDVLHTRAEKRPNCPAGYFGKCLAALTQETLANPDSSGRYGNQAGTPPNVPDEAKILTYHYKAENKAQAKADCEQGGGKWSEQ